MTHDSFAVSKEVREAFEAESGLTLRILQSGDAGEVLNRALLTAGDPQGDVIFGLDDSLLSRALDGDLLVEHRSPELDAVTDYPPPDARVTPIDHGEVCLNVDRAWFASRGIAPPPALADLVLARYRDLLVVENPATSSPGLAFLLATVATFGEEQDGGPGWQGFWRALRRERRAGRRRLGGGLHAAVLRRRRQPGEATDRRLVRDQPRRRGDLRRDAARRVARPRRSRTAASGRSSTRACCAGPRTRTGARALIDFMLSERFQADVPGSMFVYPVRDGVPLPAAFTEHAIQPAAPLTLPPAEIDAEPRPLDRRVDADRPALTARLGRAATARRPARVPRRLLPLAARRDPRAEPRRRRVVSTFPSTSSASDGRSRCCGSRPGRRPSRRRSRWSRRCRSPGRSPASPSGAGRLVEALVLVPFVLPTIVVATAFLAAAPRRGSSRRSGRSCSRTSSSTSPWWCASSARSGARSTTASGTRPRRSEPGPRPPAASR